MKYRTGCNSGRSYDVQGSLSFHAPERLVLLNLCLELPCLNLVLALTNYGRPVRQALATCITYDERALVSSKSMEYARDPLIRIAKHRAMARR
jgi:hypothetical protein